MARAPQLYRASGLSPMQYESAGKRRDGSISREGSVELRRALIDLGIGLWLNDAPSKDYAAGLRARGKKGGIIACALAHRANRIAYALVRDRHRLRPHRWTRIGTSERSACSTPSQLRRPVQSWAADEGPDQMPLRLWRTPRALRRI